MRQWVQAVEHPVSALESPDGFAVWSVWLIAAEAALFVSLAVAVYMLLRSISVRPGLGRWTRWRRRPRAGLPEAALRLLGVPPDSAAASVRRRLLAGCGLSWDARQYEAWRRCALAAAACIAAPIAAGLLPAGALGRQAAVLAVAGTLCAAVLLLSDRVWLGALLERRSHAILRDVYGLSRQLLYYAGSGMNLHVKLKRCQPFAGRLKTPLSRLLAEWYTDPAMAIDRFRDRLGTEEGYSFAETLQAMRMNDDPEYYELLRMRLHDYKEKIELHRESRKESVSYVLFVVAGLPIFYTFRVFLHPWIMEGRKLFESLN